jgi:hypothetical protein
MTKVLNKEVDLIVDALINNNDNLKTLLVSAYDWYSKEEVNSAIKAKLKELSDLEEDSLPELPKTIKAQVIEISSSDAIEFGIDITIPAPYRSYGGLGTKELKRSIKNVYSDDYYYLGEVKIANKLYKVRRLEESIQWQVIGEA